MMIVPVLSVATGAVPGVPARVIGHGMVVGVQGFFGQIKSLIIGLFCGFGFRRKAMGCMGPMASVWMLLVLVMIMVIFRLHLVEHLKLWITILTEQIVVNHATLATAFLL